MSSSEFPVTVFEAIKAYLDQVSGACVCVLPRPVLTPTVTTTGTHLSCMPVLTPTVTTTGTHLSCMPVLTPTVTTTGTHLSCGCGGYPHCLDLLSTPLLKTLPSTIKTRQALQGGTLSPSLTGHTLSCINISSIVWPARLVIPMPRPHLTPPP